jgi:hypothetical protein
LKGEMLARLRRGTVQEQVNKDRLHTVAHPVRQWLLSGVEREPTEHANL